MPQNESRNTFSLISWEGNPVEIFPVYVILQKKKKTLWSIFYGWGSAVSRLQSHYCETVYFLPLRPQEFLVFILSTWKDGRLSWPWSHPVVLKPGHLDLESNLITIPLRHCSIFIRKYYKNCPGN